MRMQYLFVAIVLSAIGVLPAGAQSPSAPSSTPSCISTTINVNSTNQGDVTPAGVNLSDQVVGSFQDLTTFLVHAFTWSNGTGTLYDYPGATMTVLGAINNAGNAVGGYSTSSGRAFGFELAANGQTKSFSVPGAYATEATGINNFGVIVGSSETSSYGPYTGFVKRGSTYTTLQFPGAVDTYASAINDAGAVVGWYYDGSNDHGFLEYQNSYTTLEPAGASSSMAIGINNNGEIVGEYRPNANAEGEGFTYVKGKYVSYMYPKSTYTQFDGVNSLGDRTGEAITGSNGFLTGPGFLRKCR